MTTMTFIHLFGILYLAAGGAMLIGPKNFLTAVEDLTKPGGASFTVGFMSLCIGALIISLHNFWNTPAEIIVSAIGWAALIKGLIYMACPEFMKSIAKNRLGSQTMLRVIGVIAILVGGLLMLWSKSGVITSTLLISGA